LLLLAGCSRLEVRTHKPAVEEGKTTGVTARLKGGGEGTDVTFKLAEGQECGKLDPKEGKTDKEGRATVNFTGGTNVEDCRVRIEAAAGGQSGDATLFVNKQPLTKVKIDGISLIVLVLIASFAVDRITRGVLFVLSLFGFWRRLVPEGEDEKRQRVAYIVVAGALSVAVLSWVGNVRLLAALGFTQVSPLIDSLFTGLLLTAGADRTEAMLQKMGAGGGDRGPLEITGKVVLEDTRKEEKARGAVA
jgi:hypothetical protein